MKWLCFWTKSQFQFHIASIPCVCLFSNSIFTWFSSAMKCLPMRDRDTVHRRPFHFDMMSTDVCQMVIIYTVIDQPVWSIFWPFSPFFSILFHHKTEKQIHQFLTARWQIIANQFYFGENSEPSSFQHWCEVFFHHLFIVS